MKDFSQPWLSLIVPVRGGEPGLASCLTSLAALAGPECEALVVAQGDTALRALDQAAPAGPAGWRLVSQPPQGPAAARACALAQARGAVALFLGPGCQVPPHLPGVIRRIMDETEAVGLSLLLKPDGQGEPLKRLAALELAWQAKELGLPQMGCAAFRRAAAMGAGGLDPNLPEPQGDLLALWLRLKAEGRELYWDQDLFVRAALPGSWRGLLGQAWSEGRESFQRLRLARSLGPGLLPGQGRERLQTLLALLSPALLAGLWPLAPDRALTLTLLCLLLLYPLNRPFLRGVGESDPDLVNRALLYCLLRPFAWLGGMLAAAGDRLGAGGGPSRAGSRPNMG